MKIIVFKGVIRLEFTVEKSNAISVILSASQSIQEVIRKDAVENELNPTEFAVLKLLYHKGEQPIQVIGKMIHISSSSITYVVDKLEQKKIVIRKACSEDRRVIYASLTNAGKTLMDQILPHHEICMDKIFCQLTQSDLNKMIELLKKIE